MNLRYPQLRELLAAEYALGTLHGRARQRFEHFLHDDPALRDLVASWEERLMPMNRQAKRIVPPAAAWRSIQHELGLAARRAQPWSANLGFWRSFAITSSALAIALLIYIGNLHEPATGPAYVAVLTDASAQPVVLVTAAPDRTEVRVEAVAGNLAVPGHSLELWLLPGQDRAPVSLGLVPAEGSGAFALPQPLRSDLTVGVVLAVSLEPAGGSPTGQPTGPVLYQGRILIRG